jgi:hypothetical protein
VLSLICGKMKNVLTVERDRVVASRYFDALSADV